MLPADERNQRLIDLIRRPISSRLIQYVTQQAGLVIPCHTSSGDATTGRISPTLPPLPAFVQSLVKRSCVKPGTLLGALVFLDRLQRRLAHLAKGMPCTCHRIFLATLIVTSKSLHDTSPKNKHWARYAVHFNLSEINLMEQQLLSLMNYQLIITPEEIDLIFIQYEFYKLQHQRHQQILPLPTLAKITPPTTTTTITTTQVHPLLPHSLDAPVLVPPLPVALSDSCHGQQALSTSLPAPIEPQRIDLQTELDSNGLKALDKTTENDCTTSLPPPSSVYPHSRLMPVSISSSSSLSSGSSASLRSPGNSSTSLNTSSAELLPLPMPLSQPLEHHRQLAPSFHSMAPDLDSEPVLFYPPVYVRDSHRPYLWTSLWQDHQQKQQQSVAIEPALASVSSSSLTRSTATSTNGYEEFGKYDQW